MIPSSTESFTTEQEAFWAGEFGNNYIDRNEASPEVLAQHLFFFARALGGARPGPSSLIEFGPNIGLNLRALKLLFPKAHQAGIEINEQAVARLRRDGVGDDIVNTSILNFTPTRRYDLAMIKGVMIHLNPAALPAVYRKLGEVSSRHVLISEYYNPKPEELSYRGNQGKLFRRDFGGEFLECCPEFTLVDYGFSYRHDRREGQDDQTWFLFERKG